MTAARWIDVGDVCNTKWLVIYRRDAHEKRELCTRKYQVTPSRDNLRRISGNACSACRIMKLIGRLIKITINIIIIIAEFTYTSNYVTIITMTTCSLSTKYFFYLRVGVWGVMIGWWEIEMSFKWSFFFFSFFFLPIGRVWFKMFFSFWLCFGHLCGRGRG